MSNLLKLIQERHSSRITFDRERPVTKQDLKKILEAGRWAPTAHNMQNFDIIVIDDKGLLEKMGNIKSLIREDFIRENYQQLSFSEKELLQKKVGVLGTVFPPEWRTPSKFDKVIGQSRSLQQTMRDSPVILIVIYDSRKRAPASEGDILGIMSLGCVMENMWLMAESLGISFRVMSTFSGKSVEKEVKRILDIPEYMKIAFAVCMGYPISTPTKRLRVRRDVEDFTHHNRFGSKGLE
ncbi:MAG: nitroreductase family protein [Hadesarchaea archaeon]|nr:nitroreductase family protein [Hadesarchaea archaeon]MDH5707235.1 nitroreductase family protein [Candidatus Aminicenantes bacterium]